MKKEFAIGLDVGGTVLKAGSIDNLGMIYNRIERRIDSRGAADEILSAISAAIMEQLVWAEARRIEVRGIGIAIGGPFDYENGVSLIKDLDKYDSIYGYNVKEHLYSVLPVSRNIPIIFDADSWSFARGEAKYGVGKVYGRGIVFTMGTGVGSAFFAEGRVVNEGPGVPWLGWISGQPFRDGILNDYLSSLFMTKKYAELTGATVDAAEIAKRAHAGDSAAQSVYLEVGSTLAGFLAEHHMREFLAECLIFGGQISKSFSFFAPPLMRLKVEMPFLKAIIPASDIDNNSLRGLASILLRDE
ncbi:MAG: ROK family protein [Rectinemataceae bacterium]